MMAKSLPLRTILRAAALFLLCAVCAMLPFFAFAVDDAGGEEHLWLITHADGTSEYSDDGIPFAAARDGDLFTALADVSMTTTAKVGTSASYTVDLRGRKISFNNGYGISGVDFYGSQRVTVLMEGAVFFSDVQMSIMFNVSDTAVMTFDGGEAGAVAYAPCFVNSIGNAQVSVNNLVFYKNSEHVKAAMCSRNNGLLELDRCAVYASGEKAPLYVNNTASIVMNASIAWSENGTVIYSDTDSGVRLTITGESLLFGSIVRVGRISAAPGARLSQLPTAATLEGGVCNALSTSVRVSYPTSVILGEVETVSRDLVFPYLIAPAVAGVAEQSERSVWARRYGDTVLYYETPYAPFMIPIADGVSFSLVRDLEVSFFPPLSAGSALSLDFSGQTLRIAPPVPTVESCAALLTYSGSFPITLDLRAATVVGASDTALLSAPAVTALTVRADDAVIIASRLFDCPQAEVLLEGGAYAVSSATAPALRARSLGMLNAQIVSYVASVPAVETAADLSMEGSRLFAIDSAGQALAAGGALALDRNSTVYGSVSAAKLSAENGAIFSSDLEVGCSVSWTNH